MKWLIYKHTNTINNKCYIGQTCKENPNYRWNNGKGYTVRNPDSHFARAIKKYGWNSFEHEIIEDNIPTQELANKRENYWITYFNSVDNGYNSNYGGDSKRPSEETIAKLSAKSKEMWLKKGDELRRIYSSKEHRAKLSKSIKLTFDNNPQLKRNISETRKRKICITNGIETRIIDFNELDNYKKNNWQRGTIYIKYNIIAQMIDDYCVSDDLSIHELSVKYGFDNKIICRALTELGVEIVQKPYRTWQKVRGIKRSQSFKQKHSDLMKEIRKNKIWVHKDGVSKSISEIDEATYLLNGWVRGRGKINSTNMKHEHQKKRIECIETGIIYESISEAARELGISKNGIINVLKQRPHSKTSGGFHWKYAD